MSNTDITQPEEIFRGSSNVYADLGLSNPEEHMAKAKVVIQITKAIGKHCLTLEQGADLIGLQPSAVSAMLRGEFADIPLCRLKSYLERIHL